MDPDHLVLHIDGLTGDSTDTAYPGQFVVNAMSPLQTVGPGSVAPIVVVELTTFIPTVALFEAFASDADLGTVTLTIYSHLDTRIRTFELVDTHVDAIAINGGRSVVALRFASVVVTYQPISGTPTVTTLIADPAARVEADLAGESGTLLYYALTTVGGESTATGYGGWSLLSEGHISARRVAGVPTFSLDIVKAADPMSDFLLASAQTEAAIPFNLSVVRGGGHATIIAPFVEVEADTARPIAATLAQPGGDHVVLVLDEFQLTVRKYNTTGSAVVATAVFTWQAP